MLKDLLNNNYQSFYYLILEIKNKLNMQLQQYTLKMNNGTMKSNQILQIPHSNAQPLSQRHKLHMTCILHSVLHRIMFINRMRDGKF